MYLRMECIFARAVEFVMSAVADSRDPPEHSDLLAITNRSRGVHVRGVRVAIA
jgi:hypothetical protein